MQLTLIEGGESPKKYKADPGLDQATETAFRVTASELRQFVERIERLDAEIKDLKDDQKDIFGDAKGRGYNTKVIRKLIALRKRDKDDVAEEDAIMDLYMSALGMT